VLESYAELDIDGTATRGVGNSNRINNKKIRGEREGSVGGTAQSMKMIFLGFGFATREVKREEMAQIAPFLKKRFSLHDDPVGLETSPELFISVHSSHKAPSGDAPFWE